MLSLRRENRGGDGLLPKSSLTFEAFFFYEPDIIFLVLLLRLTGLNGEQSGQTLA